MIIFSITWMPMTFVHFFNYTLKIDIRDYPGLTEAVLSLLAFAPLLHSISRVFCDPQFRKRLRCRKSQLGDNSEIID